MLQAHNAVLREGGKSESESCSVLSDSLRPRGLYGPWNSPSQNTGVGSLSLLQGIFPTQDSNPGLPHCRQILYQPKIEFRDQRHLRVGKGKQISENRERNSQSGGSEVDLGGREQVPILERCKN